MLNTLNNFLEKILKLDTTSLVYKCDNQENTKVLSYQSGNIDNTKPWYIIDDNDEVNIVFNQKQFQALIAIIEDLRLKDFTNHLKSAIILEKGKDIDDIMTVALKEVEEVVKNNKSAIKSINAYKLIKELKGKYPNLFFA